MRLLNYITESFNKPYSFTMISQGKDAIEYEFYSGEIKYICSFFRMNGIKKLKNIENYDMYSIINKNTPFEPSREIDMWIMTFIVGDYDIDITGTGDAMRIFATIITIAKNAIKKVDPQFLIFTASEPSRIKLYDRIMKNIGRFTKSKHKFIGSYKGVNDTRYIIWDGKK